MSKGLDDLADVDEVDFLIGSMNVRLRPADTEGNNLGSGILALKFLEEGDRATLTEGTELLAAEVVLRSFFEALLKPVLELLLLPTTAGVTALDGDLSIVGNILSEFLSHYLVSLMSIKDGAQSHGASASGRRSAHVTSNSNRG